jgi:CHAT domain-containing protein
LTVKELGAISLKKARIAYLSACSTAENSSYELSDESIHLASAFQLAGFPHVIAAFWEAKDRGAIALAGLFYQNLAGAGAELNTFESNHDVVAYALHDALCKVRKNESTRNPPCWAPIVHIGA